MTDEKNIKKMTAEQVEDTELQAENLGNQIELSKLQLKHFEKMLRTDFFNKKAKVDIRVLKAEIKRQEQNLVVFKKQARTGIFQTI